MSADKRKKAKDNLRRAAEKKLKQSAGDHSGRSYEDVQRLVHELEVHQIELEMQNKELQMSQLMLEMARDNYVDLYDFAPIGYLSIDENYLIKKANLMTCLLLGTERKILENKRFTIFIDRKSSDEFYLHRKKVMETDAKQTCVLVMHKADKGDSFYARLESLKHNNGEMLIALIDISDAVRAEEIIRGHADDLASVNKDLESFSYSVSHDLKAPLRAIDGYVRMLLKSCQSKLDEEEKLKFALIRKNVQKMGQLISDLLAFSQLGRKSLSLSVVNMSELAHRICTDFQAEKSEGAPQLKIFSLPETYADARLMDSVMINLISNAFKFTRFKKDAIIEIGCREEQNENIYYIKDNGVGFNMTYSDKLFGVFQRLHDDNQYEGTGIGLAIVQRIIQKHGGRIWAEGKEDEGATFYFSLPRNIVPHV